MDMQVVAGVISHPETVVSVGIALVAWAVVSGWSLSRGAQKLVAALTKAQQLIEQAANPSEFAQKYEVISSGLSADPVLGPRWREYEGSLVLPVEENRPVRATTRAGGWFDASLLRVPAVGVDARYHAALPNLLVGAGLLFTFLGLSAALGTAGGIIGGADQAGRNSALRILLDTASFKFITSLIGLLLSILYALFRKGQLKKIDRSIDGFLIALETRVPLLTPAALQQEANAILRKQSVQLETFSTDLAVSLGAAVDSAFNERLGEHIAPLTEAMQRLAEGIGSRNEEALKAMLDTFVQRLQGGTGDRMQEVAESLAGLSSRLEGLQTGLADAAVRMAQSADAMATRMGEGAESALARITDQMSGLTEGLRKMVDQTSTAGTNAGREMSERIESAAKLFEEAAGAVAESLAAAATNSSVRLSEQLEGVVEQLRLLSESSRTAGSEALEALAERVGTAAATFEATATRVAGVLDSAADHSGEAWGRGAEEAANRIAGVSENLASRVSGLASATDALISRMSELERLTQEAATPLAATASDMKLAGQAARNAIDPLNQVAQNIGRATEQVAGVAQRLEVTHAAAGRLIESLGAASQRFEGIDRELAKTLTGLQNGLQGFTQEIGRFVGETDQNLAKAATQLGNLVKGLQDSLEDFEPSKIN
ncbi:MAG: anti-phage defense protein ZorA [Afipia sp.]|nr:anti-phage defense protein ZorA [Afipia sp.]